MLLARILSLMDLNLDQFELDFSKLYRQMDLTVQFFWPTTIFKVAIIKTKSATIDFFSSSPFFLLALSFSPFLSLRYCDFELIGPKKQSRENETWRQCLE